MDLRLEGKLAFISGSTAGIGYSTAKLLLMEGCRVIINGRTQERVDRTIIRLNEEVPGARVSGIACDFSQAGEVQSLIYQLPEIDILINNVAVFEPKEFTEITDRDWLHFFEVNVLSGIRLARHCFPTLLKKNWGRIIFISSESGVNIPEEMIHYGVTKTAQLAVARGLAELTKGTNVTVNSVLPGPTSSEGSQNFINDLARQQDKPKSQVETEFFKNERPSSLLQRFTTTEEIASTIVYLCSPLSAATNGAAVRADGGVVRTVV